MKTRSVSLAVALLGLGGVASGQVINGDFEGGSLAPWVVTPTANGATLVQDLFSYDIDGPGPLPASNVARFQVGQSAFTPGVEEGIDVTQSVDLTAGTPYEIKLDWAVQRFVTTNNADGGTFSILADGNLLITAASGATTGMTPIYGNLTASFTPAGPGPHTIGFRITRHFMRAGELYQFVDNYSLSGEECYADCNGDSELTVADFGCFQTEFVAGNMAYADCNADNELTVADFGCFQTEFVKGCP